MSGGQSGSEGTYGEPRLRAAKIAGVAYEGPRNLAFTPNGVGLDRPGRSTRTGRRLNGVNTTGPSAARDFSRSLTDGYSYSRRTAVAGVAAVTGERWQQGE
jgi:hypothetical protein